MATYVTWYALITAARRVGRAKLAGDADELAAATRDLKALEAIVRDADGIILPETLYGDVGNTRRYVHQSS